MSLRSRNQKFSILENKIMSRILLTLLLLNIAFLTLNNSLNFTSEKNSSENIKKQPKMQGQSIIDIQTQEQVEKTLKGFTSGFIQQGKQGDPTIKYFIQNPSLSVGFGESSIKILIKDNQKNEMTTYTSVFQSFLHSNKVKPVVKNPLNTHSTYFIESRTGIEKQEYTTLLFKNLYAHIDLEYTIKDGNLKYNFYVHPGGNPKDINIQWNGPVLVKKTPQGMKIAIDTKLGQKTLLDENPISYQKGYSENLASDYTMLSTNTYGFNVENFLSDKELIIDPTIFLSSTYIGGSNDDTSRSFARDNYGNIYVTGTTSSTNFPTINAYNSVYNGGTNDIFIFKLSMDGSTVLYSTYIGGSGLDHANGLIIDANNNTYITGYTDSNNFPTVNAYNNTFNGNTEAFVLKLSANGSTLLYSTYLGSISGSDTGMDIAIDNNNTAYVTGYTTGSDFPTTIDAYNNSYSGSTDIFIAKLSANGSTLLYSSYIGGSNIEVPTRIYLDPNGTIYILAYTQSSDFPTTINAYNRTFGGNYDNIVLKLANNGSTLLYSTYIGGKDNDRSSGMTIDQTGAIYVTGFTLSANFPTTPNAYNRTFGGNYDIVVYKLSADGSKLIYSTFIGTSQYDHGYGIIVDNLGQALVVGRTTSSDFPTTPDAYNNTFGGVNDAVVLKLSANGSVLLYSTYFGGVDNDVATGIIDNGDQTFYITGYTRSSNFPTFNAYNKTFGGNHDIFIIKMILKSETSITPNQLTSIQSNSPMYIKLFWNQPSYLYSFKTYKVYRGTSPGSYSLLTNTTNLYFVDYTVSPGITYYYTITASYAFGDSVFANEVNNIIPAVPAAPTVQLTAGNHSIYLIWNEPNSRGSPISEYQIYRGTKSGQYSLIGITKNLYFNDTDLSGGTTYFYVVTAVNSIGKGIYSGEISATPFGQPSLTSPVTIITTTTVIQPETTITIIQSNSNTNSSTQPKNSPGFEILSVLIVFCIGSILVTKRRKK